MSETIEVEVGALYANLHEGFEGQLDEQYTERARQTMESFLHEFNQQVERQQERAQAQQNGELDLEEADVEVEE